MYRHRNRHVGIIKSNEKKWVPEIEGKWGEVYRQEEREWINITIISKLKRKVKTKEAKVK